MKTKLILILVLLLNVVDFVVTLFIRPVLDEANPVTKMILYDDLLLTFMKLVIVPLLVCILIKFRDRWLVKVGAVGLLNPLLLCSGFRLAAFEICLKKLRNKGVIENGGLIKTIRN